MNFKLWLESKEKVLYIMRGISGSGKSTLAKQIQERKGGIIYGTDEFHYKDGKYQFDPSKKELYHKQNLQRSIKAMEEGTSPIIIDNTNIKLEYAAPYIDAGIKNGYRVQIVEATTPWAFNADELAKRNSNRAPTDVIQQMIRDWEPTGKFNKYILTTQIRNAPVISKLAWDLIPRKDKDWTMQDTDVPCTMVIIKGKRQLIRVKGINDDI